MRASLLGWLRSAADAGLDGAGIEALFASSLRDFLERRDEPGPGRIGCAGRDRAPGGQAIHDRRNGAVA